MMIPRAFITLPFCGVKKNEYSEAIGTGWGHRGRLGPQVLQMPY